MTGPGSCNRSWKIRRSPRCGRTPKIFRSFESNLNADVAQLNTLTGQLQDQNQQLAQSQSAEATAEQYAASQAAQVTANKAQQAQLLAATKSDATAKAALAAAAKQTAAQIRNQIFQLLGGGSLTFGQAYQYAKVASQATGVNAALILAILNRESALGQNVGQCSYQESDEPVQHPDLSADRGSARAESRKHARVVPQRGRRVRRRDGTGAVRTIHVGAVRLADHFHHGRQSPSPWSNADAFVATALYLKGAMTGCQAVYSAQIDIDRCTAAKYYAGGAWKSYLWTYGEATVEQEQTFAQDIQTITSS